MSVTAVIVSVILLTLALAYGLSEWLVRGRERGDDASGPRGPNPT